MMVGSRCYFDDGERKGLSNGERERDLVETVFFDNVRRENPKS